MLRNTIVAGALVAVLYALVGVDLRAGREARIEIRGIYGGIPQDVLDGERRLADYGVNAVFLRSGSVDAEKVRIVKSQGAWFFAEFNTMHLASFLEEHPDAAPVGPDGNVSPPPDNWQGVCPTHPEYRRNRMAEFRRLLEEYELDGIWLDYHHSHAAWERPEPLLPDTCFCPRCLREFRAARGIELPASVPEAAELLLTRREPEWVEWRCGVFTDWIREFRSIIDRTRPGALLGTFHCPWTDEDFDGALIRKLAIDLKAQAPYIDVFSPMPYHARFGHARDLDWISDRVSWLGEYLGVEGRAGERIRVWPIVQLSDWGDAVPEEQVVPVLERGTTPPSTGVLIFAWNSLARDAEKVERMREFYLSIREDPVEP
jgi:hypothetical protein